MARWKKPKQRRAPRAEPTLAERCRDADPRELVVCDRCGLVQPFRTAELGEELAPCVGPLGLPCASETATFLDDLEARA